MGSGQEWQGRVEPSALPFGNGRALYHLWKACLVGRIALVAPRSNLCIPCLLEHSLLKRPSARGHCPCHLVSSLSAESNGKERPTTWYAEWPLGWPANCPMQQIGWGETAGRSSKGGVMDRDSYLAGGIVKQAGHEDKTEGSQFSYLAAK